MKTTIPSNEAPENIQALRRENESAEILARSGYDVEQNPSVPGGLKKPDYKIEGVIFDCYAPTSSNPRNIATNIERKVNDGQADRFILNLDNSSVSIYNLSQQLTNYSISGIQEIIIVKDGSVLPFFPFT